MLPTWKCAFYSTGGLAQMWRSIPSSFKTKPLVPRVFWKQSPFVRSSTKRMNLLARQIQGLSLDAAAVQMYFSSKKLAVTVSQVLMSLRNAINHTHNATAQISRGSKELVCDEVVSNLDSQNGNSQQYCWDPTLPAKKLDWLNRDKHFRLVPGLHHQVYYIKACNVERGTKLKRLDIRARGKSGRIESEHVRIRISCHIPDQMQLVRKALNVRCRHERMDRAVGKRLDYI